MNEGEIVARHYADGRTVRLCWREGKITALEPDSGKASDPWLAPPLVDIQINGYAGVDFQRDGQTVGTLLKATRGLRQAGCTRYALTLITDEWSRLVARLRHLRQLREQSAELKTAILGWHIEGPFLSPEPGFRGAHNPDVMCDPTPAHIDELRAVTGSDPVLITVAPERAGAPTAIRHAVAQGFKVSLGHTNTPVDALRAAMAAGATGFTHLANGCPKDLDRHDNILWRVFDNPGLTVGMIPDKIHVSPLFFRLAHRLVDSLHIYYTTDAMSAAGAPPGRYSIGQVELEVGADQVVRLPGKPNFAGSALRPIDGVFRAAQMLGRSWQQVWDFLSVNPARFIGQSHGLVVGGPADFCLMHGEDGQNLAELQVYVGGNRSS